MSEFHRLDADADARFLQARVADPLTRTPFRPTNEVVLCRTCGLVSLRETWEAVGGCPRGHETPARWDVAQALAAGDGAATAPPRAPRPTVAPAPKRRGWLTPLLLALGVAGILVGAVFVWGLLNDEEAPVVEDVTTPVAPTGPSAVNVTEAGLVEGALDENDFVDEEGRYRDLYTFAADSSGSVLSFTVTSEDFFPDLVIETPEGDRVEAETIARDDDTGSRTVQVEDLRGPGLYRILLTSRQPAETGTYGLRIRQQQPVRPLTPNGSAVEATLGEFSERADGFFRDRYRFSGAEGREHTITVRSSAFAPTVQLQGPGGEVKGETGRAGGVVTFVVTPERSGAHTLVVSSQSAGQRGAYTVQLAVGPEPEPERDVRDGGALRGDGTPVSDSLAAGDTRFYSVGGRVGDRMRIEVRTDGFTPSLTLVAPDGARTPAAPDGDRARLRLTLPTGGAYRVIVGASDGGGEYRVTLEQEAAVTADDIPRLPGASGQPAAPPSEQDGGGGGDGEYEPQPIGDGPPRPEAP